jgi:DNA-binding transcriptional MerR regulator
LAQDQTLPIGKLAAETGVKVPTIRYYESVDLLPAPLRTGSNRRTYDARDVRRVSFIRHARELGFEVDAIRELLALADEPQRPCEQADAIARAHLADIESKITRLQLLQSEVKRMLTECSRREIRQCRVIEVLASHGECLGEHPQGGTARLNPGRPRTKKKTALSSRTAGSCCG